MIILSICIPTYNRAFYLDKSLKSLVSQVDAVAENVEIVISDNNSTDGTEKIVNKYTDKYKYIKYYKKDKNDGGSCSTGIYNIVSALRYGEGVYRKLSNDTTIYTNGSIQKMIEVISNNIAEKPVIFWANDKNENINTDNLDDFLYRVSFLITSFPCIGVWEKDFIYFDYHKENISFEIWYVESLLKNVRDRGSAYVFGKSLFFNQNVTKKNLCYGLYRVFYCEYMDILNRFLEISAISERCISWLKKDLLFNFFLTWSVRIKINSENYILNAEDKYIVKMLFQKYKNPYFVIFLFKYFRGMIINYIKNDGRKGESCNFSWWLWDKNF